MKERRLLLFLTFLPIAMAVYIWDLDVEFASNTDQEQESTMGYSDLPLTILEQAQLTQFDQNGMQSQQVRSQRITSSDANELIMIEQPRIELHTEDGFWTATSQSGVFHQSLNRLTLNGDVTLQKRDTGAPVTMLTSQLDYYPDSRLAETGTAVTIQTTGHDIRSDGISLDLANSIYILTSHVRSRHEPL